MIDQTENPYIPVPSFLSPIPTQDSFTTPEGYKIARTPETEALAQKYNYDFGGSTPVNIPGIEQNPEQQVNLNPQVRSLQPDTALVEAAKRMPASTGASAPSIDPSSLLTNKPSAISQIQASQLPNVEATNKSLDATKSLIANTGLQEQKSLNDTLYSMKDMKDQNDRLMVESKEREDSRQKQLSEKLSEYDNASKEAMQASQINPNRIWENMGTGSKVTAAISIALGAIGAAMTRTGGNPAMDIINNAINRDMDAQKFNADNKRQGLNQKMSVYNMMLSKFGDERAAEAATRSFMLQNVDLQLKKQALMTNNANSQLQLGKMKAEIDQQIMANKQNFAHAMQTQIVKGQMQSEGLTQEELALVPEKDLPLMVQMKDGKFKKAFSEKDKEKVTEAVEVHANINNKIDEIKQRLSTLPIGGDYKEAKMLHAGLIAEVAKLEGLGMRGEAANIIKTMVPNIQSYKGTTGLAERYDLLKQTLDKQLNTIYSGRVMGAPQQIKSLQKVGK